MLIDQLTIYPPTFQSYLPNMLSVHLFFSLFFFVLFCFVPLDTGLGTFILILFYFFWLLLVGISVDMDYLTLLLGTVIYIGLNKIEIESKDVSLAHLVSESLYPLRCPAFVGS